MAPLPSPADLTDAQLVALVLGGDREQYAHLVRRHQASLYRHALGMVGCPDTAADLTQECLIRAFTRLSTCEDPRRFGAWTFRILRNGCLDHLRSRRASLPVDDPEALSVAQGDSALSMEQREVRETIFRALERIPPAQRDAFLLKHVEELAYEEISERLGASISALKMRVKRARETLQSHLAALRGDEL